MLAERAKAVIKAHGFHVYDTVDALVGTSGGSQGQLKGFPVYFEPSETDGFAVAHVDGRAVRQWLGY